MSQNGKPVLAGVVGFPISHSKSPAIHAYWLRKHNVEGHYVPLEVARLDFSDVLKTMPKMGFKGINVTIPHKETALQFSDMVSDQAALIGAANTLSFNKKRGKIYADNTDGYGFLTNLRQCIPGWKADRGPALIFGAGGAARAVLYSLLYEGTPEIRLVNRTRDRAEVLKSEFGNRVRVHDPSEVGDLLPNMATVVNTSALGMTGKPDLRIPARRLRPGTAVNDLVYTPLQTRFLVEAERQGCNIADGLGMLLHQAAAAFNLWFGIKPEVSKELRELVLSS